MMINVENVSKKYRRDGGGLNSALLREAVTRAVRQRLGGRKSVAGNEFYALEKVNLKIGEGETVGIVGRNGSGKSTLLKILARITFPSSGHVSLYGRTGSLLEVGAGLHPELTGRENVFLNGAMLGMSHREIGRKFDEIVRFAEVEEFLETPVKHFSSGMFMRLAFAVAAHVEPEIMLLDEVLAVGDFEFQQKCLAKIRGLGRRGHTTLIVSHDREKILELCERVIWLESGRVKMDGAAADVAAAFFKPAVGTARKD